MSTIALLRVRLVLDAAGGVTAPELDAAVDLPLCRRDDGEIFTPPTSLAGSLRAHLSEEAPRWLGSPPPDGGGSGEGRLEPSRVRFLGSSTELPDPGRQVRRSTAVDPRRGAAVTTALRAVEVAPAGTSVTLFLRVDDDQAGEAADLARLLATWQPTIGRGRSTGHGRARVVDVAWRWIDRRTRDGLRVWLTGGRNGLFPPGVWEHELAGPATTRRTPALAVDLVVASALHIGAGGPADDGRAPVVRDGEQPVVPGTTWKGLLRARCGYILRSCGRPACLVPAPDEASCRSCVLCDLFGWTGAGGRSGQAVGRVGRLAVDDSPIVDARFGHRNHVGIDRFTGGARSSVLYSDEVVEAGRVTLTVSTTDPADRLSTAERGLLLLALRDLHEGLVGVGRGSTRGYGSLHLARSSEALLTDLDPAHPTGAAVLALLRGEAA